MTDPTKLPVQFNIKIPYDFKRFLEAKSDQERISQNQLAVDALMKTYGREYRRSLRGTQEEEPVETDDRYDHIDPYGDTA